MGSEIEVKDLITLSSVIEKLKETFPGLVHMRIPVCNSAAPTEVDLDNLCKTLQGSAVNTPVIVNCQVGLSRSTTGCVAACLFREFQLAASYEGLVETVPGVNLDLLKMDRYKMDMSKDPLFRGEFEVIKELIAESKLSYEIMDDAAQAFLKTKIMDNIHKYFYLICFTAYLREAAILCKDSCSEDAKKDLTLSGGRCAIPGNQLKLTKTFAQFAADNANLKTMVDEGKGNLQWERDIPPAALANLENLAKTDFKANLGQIIHDIYQTAHQMFSDMPQGDHKKRAKYRFASKTLMRILPDANKKEVEGLIEKGNITLALYDILGQRTWLQPAA